MAVNSDYSDDSAKTNLFNYQKNNLVPTLNSSYFIGIDKLNPSVNSTIRFSCQNRFNGAKYNIYHKSITNFTSYFNFTPSYDGTIECSQNYLFSSDYSNSIASCIGGNNSDHRYYTTPSSGAGFAHFRPYTPAFLRHCGPAWHGDGDPGAMNHKGQIWIKQ